MYSGVTFTTTCVSCCLHVAAGISEPFSYGIKLLQVFYLCIPAGCISNINHMLIQNTAIYWKLNSALRDSLINTVWILLLPLCPRSCAFMYHPAPLDLWILTKANISLTLNPKSEPSNHCDLPWIAPILPTAHTNTQIHTHISLTDTFIQTILAGNPRAVFKRLVKPCLTVVLQAWQESTSLGLYSTHTQTHRYIHNSQPPIYQGCQPWSRPRRQIRIRRIRHYQNAS